MFIPLPENQFLLIVDSFATYKLIAEHQLEISFTISGQQTGSSLKTIWKLGINLMTQKVLFVSIVFGSLINKKETDLI